MGLKAYLNDIVEAVVTTAKGMRITARYGVDPKEEVTLQYPEERWEIPEGYRGFLHNDIKTCTACTMCVKMCPVDCISLESVRGADKRMVLASYDINIGRCMYCGLCVEVCPPKSLKHTSGYEMASVDRGELILHFIAEDAAEIKARVARQVAEAAAKAAEAAKAEAGKAAKAAETPKPADLSAEAAKVPGNGAEGGEGGGEQRMSGPAEYIFYAAAAMTVGAAILVAILPNILYAAVALLFSFAGVAGLYVLLSADFLAATQILVYVGGILVLLLFAVFLSNRISDAKITNPTHFRLPAAAICLVLFGVLSYAAVSTPYAVKKGVYLPTTADIGELLMTRYLLPFEVASVLLLAALIGAALLSRPDRAAPEKGDMEEGKG